MKEPPEGLTAPGGFCLWVFADDLTEGHGIQSGSRCGDQTKGVQDPDTLPGS